MVSVEPWIKGAALTVFREGKKTMSTSRPGGCWSWGEERGAWRWRFPGLRMSRRLGPAGGALLPPVWEAEWQWEGCDLGECLGRGVPNPVSCHFPAAVTLSMFCLPYVLLPSSGDHSTCRTGSP